MCICHALKQVKIDRRRSKCKQPTSTQKHYERSAVIEVPICQRLQKESLILPGASIRQQRLAYQGFQSRVYEDREAASVPSCGRPGEPSSSLCHSSSAEWPFSQWLSDYWAETQNLHMLRLFLWLAEFAIHQCQSYTLSAKLSRTSTTSLVSESQIGVTVYSVEQYSQDWVKHSQCWVMVLSHLWSWTLYQSHF